MTTPGSGLVVESLTVSRGRKGVVHGVNLRCAPGEIVGLIGPNGAGKSTTFHALVGLVACRADALTLNGQDLSRLAMFQRARRGLGYLPQEPSGFHGLSVRNNLRAVMELLLNRQRENSCWSDCCTTSISKMLRRSVLKPCLADSVADLKSHARWRAALKSYCWMSLSPGLIRSQSKACKQPFVASEIQVLPS